MDLLNRVRNRIKPQKFLDLIIYHEQFARKAGVAAGGYLEFGCFRGDSAVLFFQALSKRYEGAIPENIWPMYLFDSFVGLPESANPKDLHPAWQKGMFDVGGVGKFMEIVTQKGIPRNRFECIDGFYEDTLKTFTLPDGLKAGIVNIDCDYYSSTQSVLQFLRPYLQNCTLLYFDDLLSFAGNPRKGQLAAINEFNEEDSTMGLQPCPVFSGKYEGRVYWSWRDD